MNDTNTPTPEAAAGPTSPIHGRSPAPARRVRSRRAAAVGVVAGLLGGGAVGLALTVPSATSAAAATTEPSSDTTAPEPVVTDPGTTDPTTTDSTTDGTTEAPDRPDRPDRSVGLRGRLQPLVDDGTITAEQAEAVTTRLVTDRPDGPMGGHGDGPMGRRGPGRRSFTPDLGVVAEALGTDVATLRADLGSGSTLAEVAAAAGVDVQVVIDVLVDQASDRLQDAVQHGRLTDDEAADRLAVLTERITEIVDRQAPEPDVTPGG